jgi:hypothetical protein
MGLREGDLKDTIIKKISIDEFEPKTGDIKEVVVVGFQLNEQSAGKDLYTFLNNSTLDIRDVEVAPNTNEEGFFMVFLEFDRNDELQGKLVSLVGDVKNVAGDLAWEAKTHLTDDYFPIGSQELAEYMITDPEKYMNREDFESMREQQIEDQRIAEGYDDDPKPVQDVVDRFAGVSDSQRSYYIMKWAEEKGIDREDAMFMAGYVQDGYIGAGAWNWRYVGMDESVQESQQNTILEFLRDTGLREAAFSEKGMLTLMGKQGIAQFEVISFGDAETALSEAGISSEPLLESDYNTRLFNEMLGNLHAVKISEYVVVFNTSTKQALVGKPC